MYVCSMQMCRGQATVLVILGYRHCPCPRQAVELLAPLMVARASEI